MPATASEERAEPVWALPAEAASVTVLRSAVREFASAHGAEATVLTDVALAVTEATTNAVVHAFVDRKPGTVRSRRGRWPASW
jgi:serine/threonine-protein kinase RsbW/stage II sporulation protein AB (anti-sigma F factor)